MLNVKKLIDSTLGNIMIEDLNVDVDGVLYDYTSAMAKMDGFDYQGRWFEYIQSQGLTLAQYIALKFDEHAMNGVFLNGNVCDGAHELMSSLNILKKKYGVRINILGALPHKKPYVETVRCHKMQFLKTNNLIQYVDNVILVDGSKSKVNYANKTSLLIDDYPVTKERYDNAGGNMILHRSVKSTLKELESYGFIL